MQLIKDFKSLKLLFVLGIKSEHGFGFNFHVYPYRNIIGISSFVSKDKHVVFGDYEKRLTKKRLAKIKNVMVENNIALLCFFRTSIWGNKYHFISPQIYSWLDAVRVATELEAERNYLSISSVRQCFILRVSRKGFKGEPKLVKIITNPYAKDVAFSKQFLHFLKMYYGLEYEVPKDAKVINSKSISYERYRTTNIN